MDQVYVVRHTVLVEGRTQRPTATRRDQLLRAEGHAVGVTLVEAAVAEWKRQRREPWRLLVI